MLRQGRGGLGTQAGEGLTRDETQASHCHFECRAAEAMKWRRLVRETYDVVKRDPGCQQSSAPFHQVEPFLASRASWGVLPLDFAGTAITLRPPQFSSAESGESSVCFSLARNTCLRIH